MSFLKDFKSFALKGNVVDLAVAVIIGAAFSAIVSSLVEDVITPLLLNPVMDKLHVKNLNELVWGTVKYGNFLAAVIKFLIVALVLFIIIKALTSFKKKKADEPAAPPAPSTTDKLLMEIRDTLKNKN